MKTVFPWILALFLLSGCAPKIGEDILIEPHGNLRIQNSGTEIMFGVLSLLGAPVEKEPILVGGDLKITNKWSRDMKLVSLSYMLDDGTEIIARGKINENRPIKISSGEEKIIPIVLQIDMERLDLNQIMKIVNSKRPVFVKGDAVIEVWGIQRHYPFEKEATKLIQKALKKV